MQRIRFTYKSSAVHPSVFLLLFFRMAGIYVFERFFDSDRERESRLLHRLPQTSGGMLLNLDYDFDLELFYVVDEEDWRQYEDQYGRETAVTEKLPGRIVIFADDCESFFANRKEYIEYKKKKEGELLNDIINKVAHMGIISEDVKKDLLECGKTYVEHKVWTLSLLGKYFYVAEDDAQYEEVKSRYRLTVRSMLKILESQSSKWGDIRCIYIQYAVLNMAYEANLYCKRKNRTPMFKSQSLISICRMLLDGRRGLGAMEDSFNLLLAQMYDDLLKDSNMAYKYYLQSCKDYNAYVYYRKGNYWQDEKDYKKASRYYSQSVRIYPQYYRAWYMLGCCYMLMERYTDALEMFRNIGRVLKPRLKAGRLRPMEIEYLFKAQNQCAYICNKILNNPQQSIRENLRAVEVWEAIDRSEFFDLFDPEQEVIRRRVKNQLNVSKIYYEIYLLAVKIGDASLMMEYLDKLIST